MMKKIFTVSFSLLLLLILSSAYAQLNIKSTNSISERFYKDTWATVTWNGSAFLFNSGDPTTSLTLTFTLGKDKASALMTLQQISDWFNSAENKASITFEDNGNDITLYKLDGMQMVITTGDAEFAKINEYSAHLQSSVGVYPKIVHSLNIKKDRSDTPLS